MNLRYEFNKKRDNFYLLIARILPKRLLMWCFIIVYGEDREAPTEEYKYKMDFWCNLWGIK